MRTHEPEIMERLPALNYNLLTETKLRKKLTELGIPSNGPKTLLIRRHTEWFDLASANCDSDNPKSKRALLKELDEWERTQGSKAPLSSARQKSQEVMEKDFDRDAWSAKHSDDFQSLVAQARRRAKNQDGTKDDMNVKDSDQTR